MGAKIAARNLRFPENWKVPTKQYKKEGPYTTIQAKLGWNLRKLNFSPSTSAFRQDRSYQALGSILVNKHTPLEPQTHY